MTFDVEVLIGWLFDLISVLYIVRNSEFWRFLRLSIWIALGPAYVWLYECDN